MNTMRRIVVLLVCGLMSTLLIAMPAQAATSCHKINAKGEGQDQGNGVTTATILGGGLLHGTTVGNLVITGGAPPVLTIAGTVQFTTRKATLTVTISGDFDVSSGQFSATGPVTAATGKLAGATGSLAFAGIEDLTTGRFVEEVTGEICVDLAP